jgi:hypothetical protein
MSTTDKRLNELIARADTAQGRDAIDRLHKVFKFGMTLMAEHGVNTMPELPGDAFARFLEYQESMFPGISAKIFGGTQ